MEKLSKKVTNLEESRRGWDEFAYVSSRFLTTMQADIGMSLSLLS